MNLKQENVAVIQSVVFVGQIIIVGMFYWILNQLTKHFDDVRRTLAEREQ